MLRGYLQVISLAQPKIQLSLSDRHMSWLHCAGLAGLWMTLKQLEKQFPTASVRPGQLDWNLSSRSISLNWSGTDQDILDWLFKQSFQISQEGLISLTGLNRKTLSIDAQLAVHQGITGTFLQHTTSYKSGGRQQIDLMIDKKTVTVQYKGLTSYAHQNFSTSLCDGQGQLLQQALPISGWLYPGAVMSHAVFSKQTKFEVTPNEALVLLFAPVACWYFMLRLGQDNRDLHYALVIPEIYNFVTYAEFTWARKDSSYESFWCASLEDAGFQFLLLQQMAKPLINGLSQCQGVLFGKTKWTSLQWVRKQIETLRATEESICLYQLSAESLPKNSIRGHDKNFFITASGIRGRIACNLAKELPWWVALVPKGETQESSKEINLEKEELLNMIEKAQWNNQAQKLFVKACHEALRRIYAKIYDRTLEGDYAQIERRNMRIRSEVGRCKNAATFRNFLSNFFSEAGQVPTLQNHWEELLPITTGEIEWKLTRDLLLLALASYKKVKTPENNEDSKEQDSET